jgi:GTP-binding protein EngB required for normal cell division
MRPRLLIAIVASVALIWLVLAAFERALALAQRFAALSAPARWLIGGGIGMLAVAALLVGFWFWRPQRRRPPLPAPDRASLQSRIDALQVAGGDTVELHGELAELDRRRADEDLYIALFGDISTGKSTLIRAWVPGAEALSDVRGGTTQTVAHYRGRRGDGRMVWFADVPGNREIGGEGHERLAREEVLRAHAVVYLCTGDLTRTQGEQIDWLADFGKPLVVGLNKADQWNDAERKQLLARLREQLDGRADAVVVLSAGGSERFRRVLADGGVEQVERQRPPQLEALDDALARLLAPGAVALEDRRERAVLAGLHERTSALEAQTRAADAERIVRRYARRAVIGAMAAVAPGSDLLIQGVLAAGLTRALAQLYGVGVSDVEIEDFVRQARLTLRTGSSIVLAIAGNALKAFPGLGTLGGGVLHAFAYALIFDSMGKALAASLAERQALDQGDATARLKSWLADNSGARLRELATLTADTLRDRPPR